MKNFNKLYKELKKENCLEGFIKLINKGIKPEVTVYTAFVSDWDNKPVLNYDIDKDMYILVMNSKRDARKIKSIMKKASVRVIQDIEFDKGYKPKVIFEVKHYTKKMIRTCEGN